MFSNLSWDARDCNLHKDSIVLYTTTTVKNTNGTEDCADIERVIHDAYKKTKRKPQLLLWKKSIDDQTSDKW